ncbi:MAG: hypothetical protein U0Q21_09300 [Dermatophilaceae bacterium]
MTGPRTRTTGIVLSLAVLGAGAAQADTTVLFRFADAEITESSGLALVRDLYVTVNDSGDRGRVFTVDSSGATVGVTSWADRPVDIEAVAVAGPGEVWVGDIGDNAATRASIRVFRVEVGRMTRTVTPHAVRLAYADRPHNAESLLVHPVTGRLYIATKQTAGGSLYAAPRTLTSGVNTLTKLGPVASLVTDGTFSDDGAHVLLRNYGKVFVYGFPSLRLLGSAALPAQPQGEGMALGSDGALVLTSEGVRSAVLRYTLPPRLTRILGAGGRLDDAATAQDAAPVLAALGFGAAASAAAAVGASLG